MGLGKSSMLVTVSATAIGALGLAACAEMETNGTPGVQAIVSLGAKTDGASLSTSMKDPYAMGKAYMMAGQLGLSINSFREAVEKDPKSIQALNALAAAYDELHRFDLADRYYQAALDLDPHSPQTLNNLGYSHLLRGDYTVAKTYLDESKKAAPGDSTVSANLALAEKKETQSLDTRAVASAEGKKNNSVASPVIVRAEPEAEALPRIERMSTRVYTLFTTPPAAAPGPFVPTGQIAMVQAPVNPGHVVAVTAANMAVSEEKPKELTVAALTPVPEPSQAPAKDEGKETASHAAGALVALQGSEGSTKELPVERAVAADELTVAAAKAEIKGAAEPVGADLGTSSQATKDAAKEAQGRDLAAAFEFKPDLGKNETKAIPVVTSVTEPAPAKGQAGGSDIGASKADASKDAQGRDIAAAFEFKPDLGKNETKAIPVVTSVTEPAPAKGQAGESAIGAGKAEVTVASRKALASAEPRTAARFIPVWVSSTPLAKAESGPAPADKATERAAPATQTSSASPDQSSGLPDCQLGASGPCGFLAEPISERFTRVVGAVREAEAGSKVASDDSRPEATSIIPASNGPSVKSAEFAAPPEVRALGLRAQFNHSVASIVEALGGCKDAQGPGSDLCAKLGSAGGQLAESLHAKTSANIN